MVYSLATAGTKVANICNSGDANCADVNSLSNGDFDVATAQGSPLNCGGAGGTCTVRTLYDQSGALACAGAIACPVTISGAAARPTLAFSVVGGKPCMFFVRASSQKLDGSASVASTHSQPYSISMVAERAGSTTANNAVLTNSANVQVGLGTGANLTFIYAGTAVKTATASDSSFHAIQDTINGASSEIYVDGSGTSVTTPGSNSVSSSFAISDPNPLDGYVCEVGMWDGAFSSGNKSGLNSNQRSYWGF